MTSGMFTVLCHSPPSKRGDLRGLQRVLLTEWMTQNWRTQPVCAPWSTFAFTLHCKVEGCFKELNWLERSQRKEDGNTTPGSGNQVRGNYGKRFMKSGQSRSQTARVPAGRL